MGAGCPRRADPILAPYCRIEAAAEELQAALRDYWLHQQNALAPAVLAADADVDQAIGTEVTLLRATRCVVVRHFGVVEANLRALTDPR